MRGNLWKDLPFLWHFQSSCQVVQLHKILPSAHFSRWRPSENVKKLISIFATLYNFCEKTYEKTCHFYSVFAKFISGRTLAQNFNTSKSLTKSGPWIILKISIHVYVFEHLLRENLWKNLHFLWRIFKVHVKLYKSSNLWKTNGGPCSIKN